MGGVGGLVHAAAGLTWSGCSRGGRTRSRLAVICGLEAGYPSRAARDLELPCATACPIPPPIYHSKRGVEFLVAPYEADAQLAHLSALPPADGGVAAVVTEDSDLVACELFGRGGGRGRWSYRGTGTAGSWGRRAAGALVHTRCAAATQTAAAASSSSWTPPATGWS